MHAYLPASTSCLFVIGNMSSLEYEVTIIPKVQSEKKVEVVEGEEGEKVVKKWDRNDYEWTKVTGPVTAEMVYNKLHRTTNIVIFTKNKL